MSEPIRKQGYKAAMVHKASWDKLLAYLSYLRASRSIFLNTFIGDSTVSEWREWPPLLTSATDSIMEDDAEITAHSADFEGEGDSMVTFMIGGWGSGAPKKGAFGF